MCLCDLKSRFGVTFLRDMVYDSSTGQSKTLVLYQASNFLIVNLSLKGKVALHLLQKSFLLLGNK